MWTYGQPGKTPVLLGPTIVAKTGRPVVVKYINKLPTSLDAFPLKASIDPTIEGAPGFADPNEFGVAEVPRVPRSRTSTAGTPRPGSTARPDSGGRPMAPRAWTTSPTPSPT